LQQKYIGDSSKEIRVFTDGITDTMFFDFEKMNPRKSSRIEKRSELTSVFVSHGESNLEIVKVMDNSQSGVVFLLDEPDQALSIRSCYALVQLFLDVSKRHQIIASVHNPILIECVEEVLSLEHKRIMASKSFIEDHRLNPKATHPVSTSLKRSSSPKKKKPDYGFALLER